MLTYKTYRETPLLDRDFDALEDLGRRIQAAQARYNETQTHTFIF